MSRKRYLIALMLFSLMIIGSFLTYSYYLENLYFEKQLAVLGRLEDEENIDKIAYSLFENSDSETTEKGHVVLNQLGYPEEVNTDLKASYHLSMWPMLFLGLGILGIISIEMLYQRRKYRNAYLYQLENIMNCHYLPMNSLDPVIIQLNQFDEYLRQLEKESADTRERMRFLIEDIAHQIKTPLTSLKLYVEMSKDEKTKEKGSFQINRMESILTALVNLAKLEAHTIHFQFEKTSLQECLEEVLEELRPVYETKEIIIDAQIEDVVFYFDRLWLSEAVVNILRNALQYSAKKETVALKTSVHENIVILEIMDHGPGFSKESAEHLFDRFYSGNETKSRKAQGMGIGLNIAKEVVIAHHGHIYASSSSLGTCFVIELPLNLGKEKAVSVT